MRRFLLGVTAASLVNTTSVGAQLGRRAVPMIGVGTRVRVEVVEGTPQVFPQSPFSAVAQRLQGTVRAIAPETLYVALSNAAGTVAIPRVAIRRVEMSLGRPSRSASAMQVGTASAVLFALFMPSFVVQPERQFGSSERAAVVGAGIGFGMGALFGALRPYERWRLAWIPE
ncbi:MAG: hypothetical protein ABR499_15695 [Gemmatimonadaceae bacterium]